MNISLPETLRDWVEQRVIAGGYGTVSEYMRELVRQDQKRQTRAEIDAKLLESLRSGAATKLTKSDWEHIRHEVKDRITRRSHEEADSSPRKKAG